MTERAHATPLVSVVVPARNEAAALPQCLDALRQQTYPHYELVVVDNASADATADVAKAYGCRVVREETVGVGAARQRGFSVVQGEIVASTDADSTVPHEWLARIVSRFVEAPHLVGVYGPVMFGSGEGLLPAICQPMMTYFLRVNHLLGKPHFCGPNFAVRREAFWKAGGFTATGVPYSVSEDVQLSLKLRHLGDVAFDPELRVYTSPRRLRQGMPGYLLRHAGNYVRVVWLGRCC